MIAPDMRKNLAFSTDTPYERRVKLLKGSVSRTGAFNYHFFAHDTAIPHGLSYIPLVRMRYSYNGTLWFDQLAPWTDEVYGTWKAVLATADSTHVHLLGDKNGTLWYEVALYPREV